MSGMFVRHEPLSIASGICCAHATLGIPYLNSSRTDEQCSQPPLFNADPLQTLKKKPSSIKELPEWNFDGSSTEQAPGDNSDVYLRPVAMYPDPFRGGDNILVMCETYMSDGKPNKYNFRHDAALLMRANASNEFWFGLEQEYTMLDDQGWPYGWPAGGFPAPQGPYYCGNGTGKVFGRDIVDAHYMACLYAGIEISGTNAEVMPAQWEYQVGPCEGIDRKLCMLLNMRGSIVRAIC